MSDPRDPPTPHTGLSAGHSHCTNCGAELLGPYCYACGQSTKHVLKHVPALTADAVDAVFNIDGRIMHTVPALFLRPGFLAREYFAGRRMRYVPPFRLMFFMSVLAFLLVHVWLLTDQSRNSVVTDVGAEATPTEVHADLRAAMARIKAARAHADMPAVGQLALALAAHAVPMRANQRLLQLGAAPLRAASVPAPPSTTAIAGQLAAIVNAPTEDAVKARTGALSKAVAASALQLDDANPLASAWLDDLGDSVDNAARQGRARLERHGSEPSSAPPTPATPIALPTMGTHVSPHGHATLFRVHASWLPGFVELRINDALHQAEANINAMSYGSAQSKAEARRRAMRNFLSAAPPALFVLMPVMALLLQLVYIFKRRLYVEHLIVALYSHAFIFLTFFLIVLTIILRDALPVWGRTLTDWIFAGLGIWFAVYLLVMQKRVYAQGWFLTLVKYACVGFCYCILLLIALGVAVIIGLAR